MIGLQQHDPLSRVLDSKLQALHPAPVIQIQVQSYQMMRSMVEAGEGLALVDPFTGRGGQSQWAGCLPDITGDPGDTLCVDAPSAQPGPALNALARYRAFKVEALLSDWRAW